MRRFGKTTFPTIRCAAQRWSQVQDARAAFRHRAQTIPVWLTLPYRNQQRARRLSRRETRAFTSLETSTSRPEEDVVRDAGQKKHVVQPVDQQRPEEYSHHPPLMLLDVAFGGSIKGAPRCE